MYLPLLLPPPVFNARSPFLHLFLVCNRYGQRRRAQEEAAFREQGAREGEGKHNPAGITAADGLRIGFSRIYTPLPALPLAHPTRSSAQQLVPQTPDLNLYPEVNFLVPKVGRFNEKCTICKIGPIGQPRQAVRNGQKN